MKGQVWVLEVSLKILCTKGWDRQHIATFNILLPPTNTFNHNKVSNVSNTSTPPPSLQLFTITKSGTITLEEVEAVLEHVYHGPAPTPEITKFTEFFGTNTKISWPLFSEGYRCLCEQIKQEGLDCNSNIGSAANYRSYDELQLSTKKHKRTTRAPKDSFVGPLTAVQEIGWNAEEKLEERTIHGKKSCAETIYASELVKSGVFY